jgi:hypothetical protein
VLSPSAPTGAEGSVVVSIARLENKVSAKAIFEKAIATLLCRLFKKQLVDGVSLDDTVESSRTSWESYAAADEVMFEGLGEEYKHMKALHFAKDAKDGDVQAALDAAARRSKTRARHLRHSCAS